MVNSIFTPECKLYAMGNSVFTPEWWCVKWMATTAVKAETLKFQ